MNKTKEAKKSWRLIRSCTEGQNPYGYFVQDLHSNIIAALPDTTSKTERELICSAPALLAERNALKIALQDMFKLIEEGWLVRDISQDAKPVFAMRQLGFVSRLAKAKAALALSI
jgi:hypothetical protein